MTAVPLEDPKPARKNLKRSLKGKGERFCLRKGKVKLEIQKLYEELETCGSRLMEYKEHFEIMGKGRNSYSRRQIWKQPS